MEMSKCNSVYSYLKQKCTFFFYTKTENRKAKQVLFGRLIPVGREGYKKRGLEGENGGNILYMCM
jgi:hypothetical protein